MKVIAISGHSKHPCETHCACRTSQASQVRLICDCGRWAAQALQMKFLSNKLRVKGALSCAESKVKFRGRASISGLATVHVSPTNTMDPQALSIAVNLPRQFQCNSYSVPETRARPLNTSANSNGFPHQPIDQENETPVQCIAISAPPKHPQENLIAIIAHPKCKSFRAKVQGSQC
jgi:hypothetical protein